MQVRLVPGCCDGEGDKQYLTSFVINERVAFDAGSLGFQGEPEEQARVRDVVISHTHADHLASLPIFVENVYEGRPDCVVVHGSDFVLKSLDSDIFNDRIWPDFIRLSPPEAPFMRYSRLEEEKTASIGGLEILPVEMNHIVPTFGFIVDDGDCSIVLASDTAPTERIWELANQRENLAAVFLECSFPDHMEQLAEVSAHLTPKIFREEVKKLEREVEVVVVHVKPRFRETIATEIEALGMPRTSIGSADRVYEF